MFDVLTETGEHYGVEWVMSLPISEVLEFWYALKRRQHYSMLDSANCSRAAQASEKDFKSFATTLQKEAGRLGLPKHERADSSDAEEFVNAYRRASRRRS